MRRNRNKTGIHILRGILVMSICSMFLTGCSFSMKKENKTAGATQNEYDNEETSKYGVTKEKDMEDGDFYILHDGVYYPTFLATTNYDADDDEMQSVDEDRQAYFTEEEELNIPTLYMESGDKLIYYSKSVMLDYVQWERYEDLGYTVGLVNLETSTTGKPYFTYDSDDDAAPTILPGSDLEKILEDVTDNSTFYVSKVGNVDIDKSFLKGGIINNMTKDSKYSLDIYSGTQYHHYDAVANNHVFKAMELFGSIEYKTLRAYTYEIEIPNYFNTDGYYRLWGIGANANSSTGFIRIIKNGTKFNITDKDRFNTPMLSLYTASDLLEIANGKTVNKDKGIYSTCEEINKYTTEVVGSLGYKDKTEDTVSVKNKQSKLATATIRQFKINLPKDNNCMITLTPRKIEPSGNIYMYIGEEKEDFAYDAINNSYSYSLTGDGNTYTLFVSGIWESYDITLTNCHQDANGKSSSVINNANTGSTKPAMDNTETKADTKSGVKNTQAQTEAKTENSTGIDKKTK